MLSREDADVRRLLRTVPDVVRARFEQDYLVEAIPHWLYVGDTGLHLAAAALNAPAVELFLKAGADPKSQNRRGRHRCTMPAIPDPCRPEFGTQAAKQTSSTSCYGTRQIWSMLIVVESLHFTEQCAREARRQFKAFSKLERGSMSDSGKGGSTALHLAVQSTGAGGTAGAVAEQLEIISPVVGTWKLTRQHQTPRARASTTVRAMIGFEERSTERQSDGTNRERAAVQPDAPSRPAAKASAGS